MSRVICRKSVLLTKCLTCCKTQNSFLVMQQNQHQLLSTALLPSNHSVSCYPTVTGDAASLYWNKKHKSNHSLLPLHACMRTHVTKAGRREIVQFRLSDIGEGIAEVNIKEWFVTVGQVVSQFDSICEVQSDKASVTITSKFDGVISRLHYDIDDIAKVGQPLVDIEVLADDGTSDELVDEINDLDASSSKQTSPAPSYKKSLATPAVRRLAMEYKVDLSEIAGSGKDGRVMKEDILNFLQSHSQPIVNANTAAAAASEDTVPKVQATQTASAASPAPAQNPRQDQVIKLSPITRAMFKSMTKSLQIPHLGLSEEVDVSRLVQMRDRVRSEGITYLPIFMKAASLALSEFPILNSSLRDESIDELVLKADHNIGFALDTPSGLLVPNVKRVQDKSILSIAQDIKRMMKDGMSNAAKAEDLSGGTFTLSNVGSIGGTFGIPVILPPQVAIGAIGRIRILPVFGPNDCIIKSQRITVVWSADHRVIDGATITRFSNRWKNLLEEPEQMLLLLK